MTDRETEIETHGDYSPGFIGGDYQISQTIIKQYTISKKKRWRKLERYFHPILTVDDDEHRRQFLVHLVVQLHRVFKDSGYVNFVSLSCLADMEHEGKRWPGYCLLSHQTKYIGTLKKSMRYLVDLSVSKEIRQEYQDSLMKELKDLDKDWTISIKMKFSDDLSAVEFTYDPDTCKIKIGVPKIISPDPTDYPNKVHTTSEFLTFISAASNSPIALCKDLECITSYYPFHKCYFDIMDNGKVSPSNIRVNVEDCEEYDYVNNAVDVELQRYFD